MGACSSDQHTFNAERVDMSHFRVLSTIGKGGYGHVTLATDVKETKESERQVALKELRFNSLGRGRRAIRQMYSERESMLRVRSKFVMELYSVFLTDTAVVFAMPYQPGGDLWQYMQAFTLSLSSVRFITAQVVLGLEAIHKAGFVYRDLKPSNVLLDVQQNCIISDLGLCIELEPDDPTRDEPYERRHRPPHHLRVRGVCGTPGFMAPEVFFTSYDSMADVYSLGAFVYSLFAKVVPFPHQTSRRIERSAFNLPDLKGLSESVSDFVRQLCHYEERKRVGYREGWPAIKALRFFTESKLDWSGIANKEYESPLPHNQNAFTAHTDNPLAILKINSNNAVSDDLREEFWAKTKDLEYNTQAPFVLRSKRSAAHSKSSSSLSSTSRKLPGPGPTALQEVSLEEEKTAAQRDVCEPRVVMTGRNIDVRIERAGTPIVSGIFDSSDSSLSADTSPARNSPNIKPVSVSSRAPRPSSPSSRMRRTSRRVQSSASKMLAKRMSNSKSVSNVANSTSAIATHGIDTSKSRLSSANIAARAATTRSKSGSSSHSIVSVSNGERTAARGTRHATTDSEKIDG